jgi:hypothetical protein
LVKPRGWEIVPIWIERFALAVFAAVFFGLVILNALKMDLIQRTGLGIGIVGFSIFLAQSVYISKKNGISAPLPESTQSRAASDKNTTPEKKLHSKDEPQTRITVPRIQQRSYGPNSPNIIGSGNQVTINAALPPRRIPPENRQQLIQFFSEVPSRVRILSIANDAETYQFAYDWYDVLKKASWQIDEDRVMSFITGTPLFGINVKLHGDPVLPSQRFDVPNSEAAGHLANAMSAMKFSFTGQKLPDIEEGKIYLEFYANPPKD